ncbi:MAG: HU family DNA-binding protein [Dysgonamonadaceae bacterium]|jgi:nucleoid DNA-binding protein|nr:HU family DNA-binding protein [Dysgonamonadaceae bacterium]
MNEKINFQTIVALFVEKSGITKKEAELFLKEYFETINEALVQDKLIKIKNLGTFKLVEVSDRESIDVTTGNRVLIPAHYKVNFIPENNLAQIVNEPFSFFEVIELENNEKNEENERSENIPPATAEKSVENSIKETMIELEPENIETEEPKMETKYQDYEDMKKRRIKWDSIFFGSILLIVAGLFYYFYSIDKKEMTSGLILDERAIIDTIKIQIDTIKTQIDTIKIQIDKIESAVVPDKKRTVRKGERLTLIALDEYGHKSFWVYLYLENKNSIKNPDYIPVGLEIKIPSIQKYDIDKNDSAAIKKAETLAKEIIR